MIFDGRNGYVKGNLNRPNGTLIALIKGPIANKNWYNTAAPTYAIVITAGATGTVALQGTNDIAYCSNDDSRITVSADFNPTQGATWTDIQAATASSASGTVAAAYYFLRLVIVATGTGTVIKAWVNWN